MADDHGSTNVALPAPMSIGNDWRRASGGDRAMFVALAAFVAIVFALGGSARADALSQPLVYLAAIALIVAAIAKSPAQGHQAVRWPLLCLAGLAAVIALQLVPLPPAIWRSLPGRAGFGQGLDLIGLGQAWRPLSLTPDATLAALVALLPPFAMLLAGRRIPRLVDGLLPVFLAGGAISALLAVLQIGGAMPPLYRISTYNAGIGLFANRNHQAALLVCTIPLLAAWAMQRSGRPAIARIRPWIALAAIAMVLPLLMVTGSRAGLLFGAGAVVAAILVARPDRALIGQASRRRSRARRALVSFGLAVVVIVPVALAVALSRDEALRRLLDGNAGDRRFEWAGLFRSMAWDYFPAGSGFGSFESVFRAYEPFEGLADTYLNNAHNDLVEIVIEGGLPALVPLVVFVGWFGMAVARAWRPDGRRPSPPEGVYLDDARSANERSDNRQSKKERSQEGQSDGHAGLARAATIVLAILFAWSLVDYPLRTPTLAMLAAVCCLFLRVDAPHHSPVSRISRR